MRNKILFVFALALLSQAFVFAQTSSLTVEKIMRDPKWMGTSPENIYWDFNSQNVYFNWNPKGNDLSSLFKIGLKQYNPEEVAQSEQSNIVRQVTYDNAKKRYLQVLNGDIYITDVKSGKVTRLTNTVANEGNVNFGPQDESVIFSQGDNFFQLSLKDNTLVQLTNFVRGGGGGNQAASTAFGMFGANSQRGSSSSADNAQNAWLKKDQLELFDVLKDAKYMDSVRRAQRPTPIQDEAKPRTISINEGNLGSIQISPDLRFVTYRVTTMATGNKNTIVPNYVTESGYTENLNTRTKVGNDLPKHKNFIYDREQNKVTEIKTNSIPGIKDLPDFWNDYPAEKAKLQEKNADRDVNIGNVVWNSNGSYAVVNITSQDNKDRWIMRLDASTGELFPIDRQRDEAWIGGPGISGFNLGWLDNENIYFQSEATGYSHIYTANVTSGAKKQITSGNWEVRSLRLSNDKKKFYFTGSKEHPGITHFYSIGTDGQNMAQITDMKGGNEVTLSPDEKWLAIRYSYINKPWELYLQENKAGAKAVKITDSPSSEFLAYQWREPEVISFKNRHGEDIFARVYEPENPKPNKPAVIFVHGAGYLQNAHYWWSQYFREYMFHNLLTDLGYTVLDIDYNASAGYGRNIRTGIYRHMGGKDLSDQTDGAKLLVEKYGVNPKNIGIYGGSYGGFITLMALFNEPEVFTAGAALRSVTDWAHYNHGYTANILNEPFTDPIAYKRSSPIYFGEGLKGHLLMAHGMLDVNVHFQDIVRMSQKLIELGKDNWELAVYPVEDHGFTTPSGWTDEYKRILKLFEERLTHP